MWFVMLGIALAILVASGLYLRRRLGEALLQLGLSARGVRRARALVVWLLFGYPVILIASIAVAIAAGAPTLPRYDGPLATWLLVYPFFVAALVLAQALPYLLGLELCHAVMRRRRGATAAAKLRAVGVLAAVGAFAVYTPARIALERGALEVRHFEVGPRAGAPAAAAPRLRIAFLADLQQDRHTDAARAALAIERVNAARPDLVLAGGDWINAGPDHIAGAAASAGLLRAPLGAYSVRGDHEHFAYVDQQRSVREVEQALARHGVQMLRNEVRWIPHAGKRVGVLLLEYNYLARTPLPAVDALVGQLAGADYSIVVTHQLDARLAARLAGRVDLVLAGHTHGGQVNPVVGLAHVSLARIETAYVNGRYQLGPTPKTTAIVTAGVGFSIVPFRYASPGSIEIIDVAL